VRSHVEVVFDYGHLKAVGGPVSEVYKSDISFLASFDVAEKFVGLVGRAALFLHEGNELFFGEMSVLASAVLEHMNSFLN